MLKILYATCPCLSQLILAQFALKMCLAAQNHQKIHKNPYFGIQSQPKSLNLVNQEPVYDFLLMNNTSVV